jgi:hypothetical protein
MENIQEKVNQITVLDSGMKHMQAFLEICKRKYDGDKNTFNKITVSYKKPYHMTGFQEDEKSLIIHSINKEIVDLIIPVIESHIEKTKIKIENLLK